MSVQSFEILDFISEKDILTVVEKLGSKYLTPSGHGWEKYGAIPIRDAADQSTISYTDKSKAKPSIGLLSVVLAANREYNKVVKPKLEHIENEEPELKTFEQLYEILSSKTRKEFYNFWGHKDEKKYNTLKNLLLGIEKLREKYPTAKDDFDLMNQWGMNADLLNYRQDIIGRIPNIGVATFQHLRMVFGVNTVKPDQRVKEVLINEFGLRKVSNKKAIYAVEQIAKITGDKVIKIDQIFVKYGSSYYNQKANIKF